MKKEILTITTIVLTLFACVDKKIDAPQLIYEDKKLEVTIQSHHTKVELQELKETLKKDFNVDLAFTELEYDSNGAIEKINITVETNTGRSGSAGSWDNWLQSPQVFFMIDYNEDAITPFSIGGEKKTI